MGLAIALESRRTSELRLSRPLRYLAAFGLLHACVEWLDMWLIGPGGTGAGAPSLRILPLVLMVFWAANWAVIPHLTPPPVGEVAQSPGCARCHAAAIPVPAPDATRPSFAPATALADVWLRYILYLPGSLLAATGFWMEGRRLAGDGYSFIAQDLRWTALAFVGNAVMAGLVVPPAPLFPASVLNYDRFLSTVGVPPQ